MIEKEHKGKNGGATEGLFLDLGADCMAKFNLWKVHELCTYIWIFTTCVMYVSLSIYVQKKSSLTSLTLGERINLL